MFETNQNKPERILRLLIAAVLLPAPLVAEQGPYTLMISAVGRDLALQCRDGCMYDLQALWREYLQRSTRRRVSAQLDMLGA